MSDDYVQINSHGPLARLGGDAGTALWRDWETSVRERATHRTQRGQTVVLTSDTNKHGDLPDFGEPMRRIGGKGIDLIALLKAKGGARVRVLKHRVVDLHIDGHDAHGTKVKVRFPSGKTRTFWIVQANLGRHVSDEVFLNSCKRIRAAFGKRAVYNFDEIDEADHPNEHRILRSVFTEEEFAVSGWYTFVPTLVGRANLALLHSATSVGVHGMERVSPTRIVVETTIGPK